MSQQDEQAIRELVAEWHRATAAGDVDRILELMSDDVIYLVSGQPPMRGKDAFASGLKSALESFRIESSSEIQEIVLAGDWAFFWSHLNVKMIPLQDGSPILRSGHTLTILKKLPGGKWVLTRDANMLSEV